MKMVSWVCIGLGLTFLSMAVFRSYLLISCSSWKRVMGEVLKSSTHHDHEMSLWPTLEYKYEVDGEEYVNNRIFAGGMRGIYGWHKWVHDLLEDHPVKSQVPVFFHPKRPSLSCLKKEGWISAIGLFVAGGVFLFAVYAFNR